MPNQSSTTQFTNAALAFAEQQHTGFLVALWLDPDDAAQLVVPGGEPADNLHITLTYSPDAAEWDDLTVHRAIAGVERAVRYQAALDAKIGGYGRFNASDSSDAKDVFYASIDAPGLEGLRNAVEMELCDAQAHPSRIHGYTPHCTLAYLDPGAKNPVDRLPDLDLTFTAVTIMHGSKRYDLPLSTLSVFKDQRVEGKEKVEVFHVAQPIEFATPPEWSPFLPIPGTYHHPIYGELDFSPETYDRILANFQAKVYQDKLPVNAEHDPQSSGAVGWITDMRLADSGAIEVRVDWNERGKALIEADRYKYVSAELHPYWTDPVDPDRTYENVAIGMAITTLPYFKPSVLPPLVASEAEAYQAGETGKERTMPEETQNTVTQPEVPAGTLNDVQTATDQIIAQLSEKLTDKKISDPVVTEFVERAARELAEARAEAKRTADEAIQLREQNSMLQAQNRVKYFTDEVLGRSEANGTAWTGPVADHVRMACSLADKFGEKSWELQHYIQTNRAAAEQVKAGSLFKEIGTARNQDGGLTAYDQLAAKATALAESQGKTFESAFASVLASDHQLRAAYAREQREG